MSDDRQLTEQKLSWRSRVGALVKALFGVFNPITIGRGMIALGVGKPQADAAKTNAEATKIELETIQKVIEGADRATVETSRFTLTKQTSRNGKVSIHYSEKPP